MEYTDNSINRFAKEDFYISEANKNKEYELVLNTRTKNVPDIERIWSQLPAIRKDGRLYFPTKRKFYGKFKPIGSNYPTILD